MDLGQQREVSAFINNTLSRFVIAFLPRSRCLLISWLQSLSAVILEPKKIKSVTAPLFPLLFAMKWWDQILWSSSQFSLSSFTLIKRLFNSSLSVIRVASSTYLRVLIFLLAILILAYNSFILAFPMMYSACKLNKQGDNIQPYHTPTSELSHIWF